MTGTAPSCPVFRTLSVALLLCAGPLAAPSSSTALAHGSWRQLSIAASPPGRVDHAMVHDRARDRTVLFGGVTGLVSTGSVVNDTWEFDGIFWRKRGPLASPPARFGHAMAHDTRRRRTVLFGGLASGGAGQDGTWSYDGVTWSRVPLAVEPPLRRDHVLVYDPLRDRVVLFGGRDAGGFFLADTWEFDGTAWQQMQPATSPSARIESAMAYDEARGQMVLFGGSPGGSETWTWTGSIWQQLSPAASPQNKFQHAMAYDPAEQVLLLSGGANGGAETWGWNGFSWFEFTTQGSPLDRERHTVAYHDSLGSLVLFGGLLEFATAGNAQTWVFPTNGGVLPNRAPRALTAPPQSFDAPATVRLLGFGSDADGDPLSYSWSRSGGGGPSVTLSDPSTSATTFTAQATGSYGFQLDISDARGGTATAVVVMTVEPPRSWAESRPATSPTSRAFFAMAHDPDRGRTVLFGGFENGGGLLADTWEWDGSGWTETTPSSSPPARTDHALAYDASRRKIVLFGGSGEGGTILEDTWLYDGASWSRSAPASSPPARNLHAMVHDAARGRVILFGGAVNGFSIAGDTWEWDGTAWTERRPPLSPPTRKLHAMAYDAARNRVVLFGGIPSPQSPEGGATWEWDGATWEHVPALAAPAQLTGHAMAFDAVRRRTVLFGGVPVFESQARLDETWEWDGAIWTLRAPEASPPPLSRHAMVYDSLRSETLLFGGDVDGGGQRGETFKLPSGPSGAALAEIPRIDLVSPAIVSNERGARIVLAGSGLTGATRVVAEGPAATVLTDVAVESDSRLAASLPAGLPAGSYVLRVTAAGGTSAATGPTIQVVASTTPSDVTISAIVAPSSASQGGPIALRATVRNLGAGEAGGFNVAFALAPLVGGPATLLGRVPISRLASGATTDVAAGLFVPASIEPGSHVAEVTADPEQFLQEADRSNDSLRSPDRIEVSAGAPSDELPPEPLIRLLARNGGGPQVVGLDGSQSRDPLGGLLTYRWRLAERPEGADPFASLAAVTSHSVSVPGLYAFELTVTQPGPGGFSASALASVRIGAGAPRADAGPDRFLLLPDPSGAIAARFTTAAVELDGRGSADSAERELTYSWEALESPSGAGLPPGANLELATASVARIVLATQGDAAAGNALPGIYRVQLTVRSPDGLEAVDEVNVLALDPARPLPVADAGLDRVVRVAVLSRSPLALAASIPDPVRSGPSGLTDVVRLDGRRSRGAGGAAEPLAYTWQLVRAPAGSAPPAAGLREALSPTPAFVPDVAGLYELSLIVSNGRVSSVPDTVRIFVEIGRDATERSASNRVPFAEALVRDETGARSSRLGGRLEFAAGAERVFLDGSGSRDLDDGTALDYAWTQLAGPPVELAPSDDRAIVSLVPPGPGSYRFGLRVTDRQGSSGRPAEAAFDAVVPGRDAARLSLSAQATGTTSTGAGEGEGDSLAVTLPATVTLSARFLEEGSVPPGRRLQFQWSQTSGPPVALLAEPPADATTSASEAAFTPSTVGVHVFRCSLQRTEPSTRALSFSRDIRVVVDSDARRVPRARIAAAVQAAKEASPCQVVTLDGSGSEVTGGGQPVAYTWTSMSGPSVELSDPFSALTTFIAPDFGDGEDRTYVFELVVDDGVSSSEPATVAVEIAGSPAVAASLSLLPGLNLIGVPVNPATTQGAADADWLAGVTGAAFVARLAAPEGIDQTRWEVHIPGLGSSPFPVEGAQGYLVQRGGAADVVTIAGTRWSVDTVSRQLPKGVSAVQFPRGGAASLTSADLLAVTSSAFSVRTETGADGRGRFRLFHPAFQDQEPLTDGAGYLVGGSADRQVRLGGEASDCP